MTKTVHVVAHTHWDREWYFTTSDSTVLLDYMVSDVVRTLQADPDLTFCLDGQISILDDYLEIHPQMAEPVNDLVAGGQLLVGPWYTQTDTNYVAGDSIVNNLYCGHMAVAQGRIPRVMAVAYLPDPFGSSNQLPMICAGFDIDSAIIWRGIDFDRDGMEPYTIWEALSGDRVKLAVLHGGYGAFKKANSSQAFIEGRLRPLLGEIAERTTQEHILMPVGNDQNNIAADIKEHLPGWGPNFVISDYERFFDAFDEAVAPVFRGEFRRTRYSRVHRSSGGNRIDIKASNYRGEQQLLRRTQPLLAIAHELGLSVSSTVAWKAWKKLFEGQAHDGITGCVSDPVAADILNRNKQALELGQAQENLVKAMIARRIGLAPSELLVVNPRLTATDDPFVVEVISNAGNVTFDDVEFARVIESVRTPARSGSLVEKPEGNTYVDEPAYFRHRVLLKKHLEPLGYQVLVFHDSDAAPELPVPAQPGIANAEYSIVVRDGRVVLDTAVASYQDLVKVWDYGNAGDTYDYSAPKTCPEPIEFVLTDSACRADQRFQELRLTYSATLPADLDARLARRATVDTEVLVTIGLASDDIPRIRVEIDNQVLSHRLCVGLQLGRRPAESVASTPFGYAVREVLHDGVTWDWRATEAEKPIDIWPNSGVVGAGRVVHRGDLPAPSLWTFNRGMREYQVVGDHVFYTCFSSTGELGRADLEFRPGRASGDVTKVGHVPIDTPAAQVLGRHTFELGVGEYTSFEQAAGAFEAFESAPLFYQDQRLDLFYQRLDNKIDLLPGAAPLPRRGSFAPDLAAPFVSTVYCSQIDGAPVIRLYALADSAIPPAVAQSFTLGNLLEEPVDADRLRAFTLYTLKRRHR